MPSTPAGRTDYVHADMRERDRTQVEKFFDGVELLEPGVVQVHRWRADDLASGLVKKDADVAMYCGVARKP